MSADRLLQRPIYGGVFGQGRYALASMPCVSRGLYATRYMVVEPQAGAVLSVADDKIEALAGARRLLHAANDVHAHLAPAPEQFELWPWTAAAAPAASPKPVSRRRREIFERTQGRCFYCLEPLELAGPWHVEHQLPRALGGGDGRLNLVAACVKCNLRKADRTAIEFIAAANGGIE
jgi:hypothetical protein